MFLKEAVEVQEEGHNEPSVSIAMTPLLRFIQYLPYMQKYDNYFTCTLI
jgi:hypothetical protein